MAEKKDCEANGTKTGEFSNITDCYKSCINKATMFVYGRPGGLRCDTKGICECFCEKGATKDGTCTLKDHPHYNLYRNNYAAGIQVIYICIVFLCNVDISYKILTF